jgi:hypothetical protein
MKKFIIYLAISLATINTYGQTEEKIDTEESQKEIIKTADDLKSGNYKDVLSSFFQLALRDITGKDKSFGFSSTLFAIKLKSNPDLLKSENFKNETFARDLQFSFKFNFKDDEDSSFNFRGFSTTITYAVVNERDHQLANFNSRDLKAKFNIQQKQHEYFVAVRGNISKYITSIRQSGLTNDEQTAKILEFTTAVDLFNKTGNLKDLPEAYLKSFEGKFDEIVKDRENLAELRKQAYAEIDKGWLFTVALSGTTDKVNKLNSGTFNTVLLKGDKPELDIRTSLSYADTVVMTKFSQLKFNSTAGLNFSIAKTGDKSLVEFKPYFEYKRIVHNPLPGEKRDFFLANADLRIKILKELWLPLTIKYDLKDHNFLGFLNVSFNVDGFK